MAAARDRRFHDLRVVVLGAGAIGREVGRLLGAIGMNVALVGRTARDTSDGPVRAASELEDLLADADIFVVALPLTAQTRGLVDDDVLRALPSSSLFVNVGRGLTVAEPALVSALREGRMAAAALDAFAVEPLPRDSPLWSDPRVFVSPHSSSRTRGWRDRLAAQFVEQFRLWHAGRPLTAAIDKRRGVLMDDGILLVSDGGAWTAADPARPLIRADDLAATRGDGVFEAVGVFAGVPLALGAHLGRLGLSMTAVGLAPWDATVIAEGVLDAIERHPAVPELLVKVYVSHGPDDGRAWAWIHARPNADHRSARHHGLSVVLLDRGVPRGAGTGHRGCSPG